MSEKSEYQRGYAKINLTLDVGSLRDDGFHDVTMVMQTTCWWLQVQGLLRAASLLQQGSQIALYNIH